MAEKSKLSKDLQEAVKKADAFENSIKEASHNQFSDSKVEECEPQTKLSQKELNKSKDIYLKPRRTISSKEKFNETYRSEYEFKKEYVCFIAENKEVIGESITPWTKPFAGIPAEEWEVPVNKPVWGPRYLAEQIKGCSYHKFTMQDTTVASGGDMTYYGSMAVDNVVQRLDAIPANTKRSVFGAQGF